MLKDLKYNNSNNNSNNNNYIITDHTVVYIFLSLLAYKFSCFEVMIWFMLAENINCYELHWYHANDKALMVTLTLILSEKWMHMQLNQLNHWNRHGFPSPQDINKPLTR